MNLLLCRNLEHNSLYADESEECFGQVLEANETYTTNPILHAYVLHFWTNKKIVKLWVHS